MKIEFTKDNWKTLLGIVLIFKAIIGFGVYLTLTFNDIKGNWVKQKAFNVRVEKKLRNIDDKVLIMMVQANNNSSDTNRNKNYLGKLVDELKLVDRYLENQAKVP